MAYDQAAQDELKSIVEGFVAQRSPSTASTSKIPNLNAPAPMSPEASQLFYQVQMNQPDTVVITPQDREWYKQFWTGMKQSAAEWPEILDGIADFTSRKFGVPKTEVFRELADTLKPEEAELADNRFLAKLARSAGHVPMMIGELFLGTKIASTALKATRLPRYLAKTAEGLKFAKEGEKIAAGGKVLADIAPVAAMTGLGAGKTAAMGGSLGDILQAGGLGALTGLGFEALRPLGPLAKPPAMGALFGGTSVLGGADLEQAMADALLGAGLGLPGAAKTLLGGRPEAQPRQIPVSKQLALPPGKPAPLQLEWKGGGGGGPRDAGPVGDISRIIAGEKAGDAVVLGRGGIVRSLTQPPNVAGEKTVIGPDKPVIEMEPTPGEKKVSGATEKPLNAKDTAILKKLKFTDEDIKGMTTDQREAIIDLKVKKGTPEAQEILTKTAEEATMEAETMRAMRDLRTLSNEELQTAIEEAGTADQINAVKAEVERRAKGGTQVKVGTKEVKVETPKETKTEAPKPTGKVGKETTLKDSTGRVIREGDEVEWRYGKNNAFKRKAVVYMDNKGKLIVNTDKGNQLEVSPDVMKTLKVTSPEVKVEAPAPEAEVETKAAGVDIKENQSYQGKRMTSSMGPNDVMLVATKDGKDVGFLWVTKEGDGFKVKRVEVDKKFQRQGIATELVTKAESMFGKNLGEATAQTAEGKAFTEGRKAKKEKAKKPAEEKLVEEPEETALGPGEEDLTVEAILKKLQESSLSPEAKKGIEGLVNTIQATKKTADTSKQTVKLPAEAQADVDNWYRTVAESNKLGDAMMAIAKAGSVDGAVKESGLSRGQIQAVWIKEGIPAPKKAEEFAQWRAAFIGQKVAPTVKKVGKETLQDKIDKTVDRKEKAKRITEAFNKAKRLAKKSAVPLEVVQNFELGGIDKLLEPYKQYFADRPSELALINELAFKLRKMQEIRDKFFTAYDPSNTKNAIEKLTAAATAFEAETRAKLAKLKPESEEYKNTLKAARSKLKNIISQVDSLQVKEKSDKFLLDQAESKLEGQKIALLHTIGGLDARSKQFYANQFVVKDPDVAARMSDPKAVELKITEAEKKNLESITGKSWEELKDFIVKEIQPLTPTKQKVKAFKAPITHLLPRDSKETAYLGWVSVFSPEYRRGELGTAIFLSKLGEGKYGVELVDMNFSKVHEIPGTPEWDARYAEASPEVKRDMDLMQEYFKNNPKKLEEIQDLMEVANLKTDQIATELENEKAAYLKANDIKDAGERERVQGEILERIDKYEQFMTINEETGLTQYDEVVGNNKNRMNMKLGRVWAEIAREKLADPANIGRVVGRLDITKDPKSQAYKVSHFELDPAYPKDPLHREILERVGVNFKASGEKFRSSPEVEAEAWRDMEKARIAKKAEDGNWEYTGEKFDIGSDKTTLESGFKSTVETPEEGWAQSPRLISDNIMDWRSVKEEMKAIIQKNPKLAEDIAAVYKEVRNQYGPTVGKRKGRLSKEAKIVEGTIGRPELLFKRLKDAGTPPEILAKIREMMDEAAKEAAISMSMTQKSPVQLIPWGERKGPRVGTGVMGRTGEQAGEAGLFGFGREDTLSIQVAKKHLQDAIKTGDKKKIKNAQEIIKTLKMADLAKDQLDIVDVLNSKLFTIDHNRPIGQTTTPEAMAEKMMELKGRLDKAVKEGNAEELSRIKGTMESLQKEAANESVISQVENAEAEKNVRKAQVKLMDIVKDFVDEGVETPEQAEAIARKFVRDNGPVQKAAAKRGGVKLGMGVDPTDLVATGKAIPEALSKFGKKTWSIFSRWGKYPEAKAELERILPYVTSLDASLGKDFFRPENIVSPIDPRVTMGGGPLNAFGALYNNENPYVRRVGIIGLLTDIIKRRQRTNITNFMGELDGLAHKSKKGYEGAWIEARNAIEEGRQATDEHAGLMVQKIKPVLEDIAGIQGLKERGLYIEGYWPRKVDKESFWRHYRSELLKAKDFEELPDFLQDRLDPERLGILKKIANDNPTWEHMNSTERLMVQKELYNWLGKFTYDTLPPDIQEMIPRESFNKHEQERSMGKEMFTTNEKGEKVPISVHENPRDALLEYFLTTNHVATTNDMLAHVRPIMKAFPGRGTPGTAGHLMEKFIRHNMLGGEHASEKAMNSLIKRVTDSFGQQYDEQQATQTMRKIAGEVKTGVAAGVLGPATGVVNLAQGFHELVDTGRWPILKGLKVALAESGKTGYLGKLGIHPKLPKNLPEGFAGAWDLLETSGRGGRSTGMDLEGKPLIERFKGEGWKRSALGKADKLRMALQDFALSPLTFSENINKAGHIIAALERGAKEGRSFRESLAKGFGKLAGEFDTGKDISQREWDAYLKMLGGQFGAGAAHTSPWMRSPLASLSTIFWSYPAKTAQFVKTGISDAILSGDNNKLFRYMAYIGAQATLAAAIGYLGGDVSHIFGMGIPPKNVLSMPWQMLKNAYSAASPDWAPGSTQNAQDTSDAWDDVLAAMATISVPGYKGWGERTYKMLKNIEQGGRVTTKGEYKLVATSPFEEILSFMGVHPMKAREAYDQAKRLKVEGQDYNFRRGELIKEGLHLLNGGRSDKILDLLKEARDDGIQLSMGDIYKAKRDRERYTALTKMASRLPKPIRERYQKEIKQLEKEQFPEGSGQVGQGDRPMWSQSTNPSLLEALSSLEGITE